MEYESNESQGGFFDRIKESPRTVSAIIIILIVAAAIYAFSGRQIPEEQVATPAGEVTEEGAATTTPEPTEMATLTETTEEEEAPATPAATSQPAPIVAPREPVSREQLQQLVQDLPAGERNEQGFTETAQAGDGITHLARRAATRYLAETDPGFQVTSEHRIYIEDYLKDAIGREGLAIGETRNISTDLMRQAVEAAGQLTDRQLQNLSKYTYALQ